MDFKRKVVDKLKEIHLDDEGAPRKKPFLITFGLAALGVVILVFLSGNQVKEAAGGIEGWNPDLPPEKEASSVQLTDDSKYLTRKELGKVLNQSLSSGEGSGITAEEMQRLLDEQKRSIILQVREEREREIEELQLEENAALDNDLSGSELNDIEQKDSSNTDSINSDKSSIRDTTFGDESGSFNNNSFEAPGNSYQQNSNSFSNQSSGGSVLIAESQSEGSVVVNNSFEKEEPGYSVKLGVPVGTMIPSRLEIGLISSQERAPAVVRVMEDVKYKGEVMIPKDAVFYGYGEADYSVRQMFVTLEKLVIGDREIDVEASLVKDNGTPGFCTEYIDIQKRQYWYTSLANFAAGVANAFKDKIIVPSSDNDDSPIPQTYYENNLKNATIDGIDQGVEGWTEALANDAKEQEAIILVKPRLKTEVLIKEKITIDKFNNQ